jgi:CHASE3 domain sensor protein
MPNPFYNPSEDPQKSSAQLSWAVVVLFMIAMGVMLWMVLVMSRQMNSVQMK